MFFIARAVFFIHGPPVFSILGSKSLDILTGTKIKSSDLVVREVEVMIGGFKVELVGKVRAAHLAPTQQARRR